MIAELGHYALVLALALALVQSVLPLLGAKFGDASLMASGSAAAISAFFATLIAFAALTNAYVSSDFSLLNVWQNSHSMKPMLFKVTGVWGNHEGSMLLWVLILAFFLCPASCFCTKPSPDAEGIGTLRTRLDIIGVPFVCIDHLQSVSALDPRTGTRA